MKWQGREKSDQMEDRRGSGSSGKLIAGGGIIGLVVLLINLFGSPELQSLTPVLEQFNQGSEATTNRQLTPEEELQGEFMRVLLKDNENVWFKIFQENGMNYVKSGMVLFVRHTDTGCGFASAATGPFYCPADQKVYIDLGFFDELKTKYGAQGGDFAVAYVLAHEIGHHVQTLLGTSAKVRQLQEGMNDVQANKLSVALELQADFYAGVWTHYNQEMQKILEEGDIEEALSAASAVGDDAIQKRVQGEVVPDSFTHGTSEQRKYWFMKGYTSGDFKQGDTFNNVR